MDASGALRSMVIWPASQEGNASYQPGTGVDIGESGLVAYAAVEADELLPAASAPSVCSHDEAGRHRPTGLQPLADEDQTEIV